MTFAPILGRELRVRARNQATYWIRFGIVLVAIFLCLPPLLGGGWFGGTNLGKQLLDGLVAAGFLLSCAAALLTADAVSSEQREGTLGLLFLTRVRGLDLLAGKLGSAGIAGFCALLATAPLLMLPTLAGGVTGGEVARKVLVLANTLFLALAAGLFASSLGPERGRATRNTAGLMTLVLLIPVFFSALGVGGTTLAPLLAWASPIAALGFAADSVYRLSPAPYGGSLALQHGFGWLLLIAAAAKLRFSVRQQCAPPASPPRERMCTGGSFPAVRSWRFDYGGSPVEWLVRRQPAISTAIWTGALLSAIYPLLFTALFRFWMPGTVGAYRGVLLQIPSFAVTAASDALFAWAASRFLVQARQNGELELLLTTPVGANSFIVEQWNALKQVFRAPLLVMLAVPLLQFVGMISLNWRYGFGGSVTFAYFPTSLVLSLAHTVLGLAALCWVALWFGLKSLRQSSVVVWTVLVVKGVPYVFSTFSFFIFVPFLRLGLSLSPALGLFYYPVTQLLVLGFYVWLMRTCKARLLALFPPAAPRSFNLQRSLTEARAKVRAARHWTPS